VEDKLDMKSDYKSLKIFKKMKAINNYLYYKLIIMLLNIDKFRQL
jgi:hypothetical protein